jgi:hypothetical protein
MLAFIWELGVLGLCLMLGPSIAYGFIIHDDSSVNRRFLYKTFKVSLLAFYICLLTELLTLTNEVTSYCIDRVSHWPGANTWD